MLTDNQTENQSPVAWSQIAVLFVVFAVLLVILLAEVLPPRPRIILPQNVHQLQEVLRLETEPTASIKQIQMNTAGDTLIATAWSFHYLWHLAEGSRLVTDLRESGGYTPQIFLSGTQPVATFLDWSGTLSLLDMESGQRLQLFEGVHASELENWAFSRDGRLLAISDPQTLSVMDVATQEGRFTIPAPEGHSFWYSFPTFNATGDLLAAVYRQTDCSECEAKTVIWDAVNGTQRALLGSLSGGSATAFAFSHDNQLLAVGGYIWLERESDSLFQLWDLETGVELVSRRMEGYSIDDILMSQDKRLLAARDGGNVWLWRVEDLISGGPPLVEEHGNGSTEHYDGIAFSPDYRLFAYGTPDGRIRLVDTANGALLAELRGHSGDILELLFSVDGRLLVSSGFDHTIRLWALDDPGFAQPELQDTAPPAPVMTPTVPGG